MLVYQRVRDFNGFDVISYGSRMIILNLFGKIYKSILGLVMVPTGLSTGRAQPGFMNYPVTSSHRLLFLINS